MEFKKCRLCNEEKENNQFKKSGKYIRKECKTCENKETLKKNKKKYSREYKKREPIKSLPREKRKGTKK